MKEIKYGLPTFSLEHYCDLTVAGKIDRSIYTELMQKGIQKKTWVVEAHLKELSKLYPNGNVQLTRNFLANLMHKRLIFEVCETNDGMLVLVPALKKFVPEDKLSTTRRGQKH